MNRVAVLLFLLAACSREKQPSHPPANLLGRFQDDYGNRYRITETEWTQLPHGRFHILRWETGDQYLLAQNDSANGFAPGKWTRIDWMPFEGMAPFAWGFCLTAFDAPTAKAAAATAPAARATPRTGCNGYPFSRMQQDTSGS